MKNGILLLLLSFIIVMFTGCASVRNYFDSIELTSAIRGNDIQKVEEIVEKNPDCINTLPTVMTKGMLSAMNLRGTYPLTEACIVGNIDMIKLLVENGADVSCNSGITPLSVIYRDKPENWYKISLFLIESGADINYYTDWYWDCSSILQDIVQTRPGGSAIDYKPEDPDEVMLAFNYAMENCDHSKVNWMSVMQQSVTYDRIEIVTFLLDEGYCDVNDRLGSMTALMLAARDSTVEMVELLLTCGADTELVSDDGKTAYDYAVEFGEEGIADLLKE